MRYRTPRGQPGEAERRGQPPAKRDVEPGAARGQPLSPAHPPPGGGPAAADHGFDVSERGSPRRVERRRDGGAPRGRVSLEIPDRLLGAQEVDERAPVPEGRLE